MEPHLFRISSGAGSGEAYTHEGEEFLYVLRGRLEIALDDGECYHLRPGDSFYFESDIPHSWVNPGKHEAWVLWINTPPFLAKSSTLKRFDRTRLTVAFRGGQRYVIGWAQTR